MIVAARTSAAGAESLLAEALGASACGARVSILFSDGGLEFLDGGWPERLADAGVDAMLCARSARERGVEPAAIPASVRWSSLTNFLADAGPDVRLWTVFG